MFKAQIAKIKERYKKFRDIKICGRNLKAGFFFRKISRLKTRVFYKKYLKEISNFKLAIHLHLFYIDLLDEFIDNLKNIPVNFDLYITLVDRPSSDIQKIFKVFPHTKIFTIPNIGRDPGGLIEVLNHIDLNTYDILIKIHSKKSLHTGQEQQEWRKRLVGVLMGSKKQSTATLHQFCDKEVGMVGSYEDLSFAKYDKIESFQSLCSRLEIDPKEVFFKGTMFAIRTKILQRFVEKNFHLSDFEVDEDYLNYTLEYAFGSLCFSQGYKIVALEDINYKRKKRPSKKVEKLKNLLKFYSLKP